MATSLYQAIDHMDDQSLSFNVSMFDDVKLPKPRALEL